MTQKHFTLEEANNLLPIIKRELELLQSIKHQFDRKNKDLQHHKMEIFSNGNQKPGDDDPFFKQECALEFLQMEAHVHINNIQAKGAQLKDIDLGLIDFPGFLNGQEVLWCWKLGEEKINHYHGASDGFAGRKPID
jgi:hypothetical protein